jgi:hypothetical protein
MSIRQWGQSRRGLAPIQRNLSRIAPTNAKDTVGSYISSKQSIKYPGTAPSHENKRTESESEEWWEMRPRLLT